MAPAGVLFDYQKSGGGEKLPEVMHKSLQFDVASIDEEQGIFEGYASVWDIVDHDGDVVEHGAFAYTIREGAAKDGVPILALHNDHWLPVGRTLELREDDVGLYIKGYISPTSMGKDVRILIRDKVLKELSIGYCVIRHTMQGGIRHLQELELPEISIVTWAANSAAQITGYKGGTPQMAEAKVSAPDGAEKSVAELLAEGKDLIAQLRALGVEVPDDGAEDLIEIEDEETEE